MEIIFKIIYFRAKLNKTGCFRIKLDDTKYYVNFEMFWMKLDAILCNIISKIYKYINL